MNKLLKIILSFPSIIVLFIIPYNFFAEPSEGIYNMVFNALIVIQVLYLAALIYILYKLWSDSSKSKSTKWTWTLLMIFCMQPIATLVYLWAIEPIKKDDRPLRQTN